MWMEIALATCSVVLGMISFEIGKASRKWKEVEVKENEEREKLIQIARKLKEQGLDPMVYGSKEDLERL